MKKVKKVAMHSLGCKVNSCETKAMQAKLEGRGFEMVPFDEVADIYIVNTCTVTGVADQKSRKLLRRARRQNGDAVIVAVGCLVDAGRLKKGDVREETGVDLWITNDEKERLDEILLKYLANTSDTQAPSARPGLPSAAKTPSRAFIKIQDGCDMYCSYCIVPYVRGRARSKNAAAIIAEAKMAVAAGYQEIVLTGINLSAYGGDRGESAALIGLLEQLSKLKGLMRIRLSSLEQGIITPDFARRMAALPKVCPHFHLSLQSGSDTVLGRMNRRYGTAEYYEKVEMLRAVYENTVIPQIFNAGSTAKDAVIPQIFNAGSPAKDAVIPQIFNAGSPAITTDIITGFPGETDEEFMQTKAFVQQVGFAGLHVFPYSKRAGTQAAALPGQIPPALKKERCRELILLGETLSREYRTKLIGRAVSLILEEKKQINGKTYWLGYSAEYVRVAVAETDLAEAAAQPGYLTEAVVCGCLTGEIMLAVTMQGSATKFAANLRNRVFGGCHVDISAKFYRYMVDS